MDHAEAQLLLAPHVRHYRVLGYATLREMILRGENPTFEEVAPGGTKYQFDIVLLWDDKTEGDIRVICQAFIDPRGKHVMEDFILAPNGAFVDE